MSFGGHSQAAGLRIERRHIADFTDEMMRLAGSALAGEELVPKLDIDAETMLASLDVPVVSELWRLAPFGQDAPPPILASRNIRVGSPRRVGASGRHLAFYANQGQTALRAIAFGMGDLADEIDAHDRRCNLAFVPKISNWQGRESVELEIRDVAFEDTPEEN